jgi:hypothetical protein
MLENWEASLVVEKKAQYDLQHDQDAPDSPDEWPYGSFPLFHLQAPFL